MKLIFKMRVALAAACIPFGMSTSDEEALEILEKERRQMEMYEEVEAA